MVKVAGSRIAALQKTVAELLALANERAGKGWRPVTYSIVEYDPDVPPEIADTSYIPTADTHSHFEIVSIPEGVFVRNGKSEATEYQFKDCPDDDPHARIDHAFWSPAPEPPEGVAEGIRAQEARAAAGLSPVATGAVDFDALEKAKEAQRESALAAIEATREAYAEKHAAEAEERKAFMLRAMAEADALKGDRAIVITPALPGPGLAAPRALEQPHELPPTLAHEQAAVMPTTEPEEASEPEPAPEPPPKPAVVVGGAVAEPIKQDKVPLPSGLRFAPVVAAIPSKTGLN